MDCKTAGNMVLPYIHKELSGRDMEEFLEHIKECPDCYEELEIYFTVSVALRKLREDREKSYDIQRVLRDELKSARRKMTRRKIMRIGARITIIAAEVILLVVLLTRLETNLYGTPRQTTLYRVTHIEEQTEVWENDSDMLPDTEFTEDTEQSRETEITRDGEETLNE